MRKLELKDIAGYLPYNLLMFKENCTSLSLTTLNYTTLVENEVRKPILRPMSALYKPCLEDGKIPIVELAKIALPYYDWLLEESRNLAITAHPSMAYFSYKDDSFESSDGWDAWHTSHQIELFQKLYEWHFDIHGLIGQGLAIDIKTL
ncbi:hypothetical protein GGR21_002485 [Dysgonomonas hofstadii]|uniref:Uncharacterized protein n=1 Tax=Dysgonomonas hofstadii TaxID=637886 RepID=A0A840CPG9_9BACT|nr:hypothetical protein [Dysgonomonas hofstadii]MBB4036579.1 hypothetical protein [Dysgonomonas hofstadii]